MESGVLQNKGNFKANFAKKIKRIKIGLDTALRSWGHRKPYSKKIFKYFAKKKSLKRKKIKPNFEEIFVLGYAANFGFPTSCAFSQIVTQILIFSV